MRVHNVNIGKIYEPKSDVSTVNGTKSGSGPSESDEVTISSRAVEVAKAQQYALSLPDAREDLVSKFRSMIADSQYKISDDDLAQSIINNMNEPK